MPRFKHYNYDQDAMFVINYQEQLQPTEQKEGTGSVAIVLPGAQH